MQNFIYEDSSSYDKKLENFQEDSTLSAYEEGDVCPECGQAKLYYPPVENCSCHINPPCTACINNKLTCPECEWEDEN